jgi:hypothetical protein
MCTLDGRILAALSFASAGRVSQLPTGTCQTQTALGVRVTKSPIAQCLAIGTRPPRCPLSGLLLYPLRVNYCR